MEAKIRIIEILPKIQTIKTNSKDVISISFISNNIPKKIEDIEQSISKNQKIIINLKNEKGKNKVIVKCLLSRKNNNIIASGDLILEEGLNWYKLNEVKNNKLSKESLITASTSNGNIQKVNIDNNNINPYLIGNSPNSLDTNISIENNKFFSSRNSNTPKNEIKIKLMVIFLKRKNLNKNNILSSIKETKDNLTSAKDTSFEKGNDIFECTLNDYGSNRLNPKMKILTAEKKNSNIRKAIFFGNSQQKNSFKKNMNNKNFLGPTFSKENTTSNYNQDTIYSMNLKESPTKILEKIEKKKKIINEKMKMKTSHNFYRKQNYLDNKYSLENKIDKKAETLKKEKKHHKTSSCENFEDKILDQNFKNFLKNDENLKEDLSCNDSCNSIEKTNTERQKENNEAINKEKDINNNCQNIELNYQSQNSNEIYSNIDKNNENVDDCLNDNYERLKIDFLLLYSAENIKNINKEDSFLETQLMIEKLLALQKCHQKEYNQIFNSINDSKKLMLNYQKLYLLISRKMNILNLKKIENSFKKKNNELCSEKVSNFIKIRKKLISNNEFPIWNKLMKSSNQKSIIEKSKNKMINIFLNICSKNENKLNKLSLKFYNEIKEKQNKKMNNKKNEIIKKNKYKNNINKKLISIDTKNNNNFKENNFITNKTNKNFHSNIHNIPSGKNNKITDKNQFSRIITNETNKNYGTLVNETVRNFMQKKKFKKLSNFI